VPDADTRALAPVRTIGMAGMSLKEHPDRLALADELHSRPHSELASPCAVSSIALITDASGPGLEPAIADLCRRYGAPPPHQERHHAATLGTFRLRWERHTEFDSLIVIQESAKVGFKRPPIELLPEDWLAGLEGELVAAIHVVVEPAAGGGEPEVEDIERLFEGQRVVGGKVLGGSAEAFTAFRHGGDGFGRFYVRDHGMSRGRVGRLVQRLVEIDTYRMMALLGLTVAKTTTPLLNGLEARLVALVGQLGKTSDLAEEQGLLDELFAVAQESERLVTLSTYRFSATEAYGRLVHDRLKDLRETRLDDFQPIAEFLDRRFEPAQRTCASVAERQESLSRRIARTSDLARTRVDVALQKQNRALLASMERRARMQLRLQQTVEGLSVVAISYYALGIVTYLLGGLVEGDMLKLSVSAVAPVLLIVIWFTLRRWRERLAKEE
jgi:uncharacterized membrane-anchored protein